MSGLGVALDTHFANLNADALTAAEGLQPGYVVLGLDGIDISLPLTLRGNDADS